MSDELEPSRIALVTGGSRGIGRAIALDLARRGHRVVVNYARNADAADGVVKEIDAAGGAAMAVRADVGLGDDVTAMFATIKDAMGTVDVLVNNAGITRDDLLLRMDEAGWDDVIETNLKSNYLCSKAAVRQMIRNKWGRIVSVGSVSGVYGNAGQANYAASKAGVMGFAKALAKEVGSRGITVNVVAPGFVETDLTADLGSDVSTTLLERIALRRLGQPDEVASLVGYLASDEAGYITGQTIVMDGGLSL